MPRNLAAQPVRFFVLDVSATVPLLAWMIFPSWETFWGAVGFGVLLSWLGRNGWTLSMLGRALRGLLVGPEVRPRPKPAKTGPEVPYS